MKVKVEKLLEESKVKLTVNFTEEEYKDQYDVELKKVLADVEVPGFRKGKVPQSMYLKKFGDSKVVMNTMDTLINKSYQEVVTNKKIKVVGYPTIDLLEPKKGFGYTAVVSVLPEIVAKDYKEIEVEKEEVVVTEEDVQKEINRVLSNSADLEVVEEGTLENGNTAVFDFVGKVDGVEFEGGKAENYSLEIGSGQFIPGFEEQMVGMKVGEERTLKVKFPEAYQADNLAGKDAEFDVKLHEIKVRVLPELNDAFVEGLEIENVKTVEAYKEMVKATLTSEKEEASKNKFEDDVMTKLIANNPFTVPAEMIEDSVNRQVEKLENQAKAYGLTADLLLKYQGIESLDQYKELLKPGVENSIKEEFILESIAKVEKLKLAKEDYDKYYGQIAGYQKKTVKEVKDNLPKEVVKDRFLLFKARDLVLESVVVK